MRACFAIALDTQMKHGSVKARCKKTTPWSKQKRFCGQFCENDIWC